MAVARRARARKARRPRRSPEEARALILSAAQRLLAERGPDAVGLKEVAGAAGVSHALVSHYFGTYDTLVEEALRAHLRAIRAETLRKIADAREGGPAEWIDMTFAQLAHPLSGRLLAWAILSERIDSDDFFPAKDQGMRFVADALEARAREELGDARAPAREDVEFGALLVFSAALGYSVARNVLWASLSRTATPERDRWFREKIAALFSEAIPAARALRRRGG